MRKSTIFSLVAACLALSLSPNAEAQQKDNERVNKISGKHSLKAGLKNLTKFNGHDAFESTVRVKFKNTPKVVAKLDKIVQSNKDGALRRSSGSLKFGEFTAVSALNDALGAVEIKRVFRPAGKFEQKHREFGLHLWYEVKLDNKADLNELLAAYGNVEDIQLVEPRYAMDLTTLPGSPDDPQYSTQSSHYDLINLVQAWGVETGNANIVVAIEDQGVDYTHPDLAGNMWINSGEIANNGIDDDNNGYIDDYYGYNFGNNNGDIAIDYHGTHVGGTVAAETNNGVGVSGIAGGNGSDNGVRLMSLSVFGNNAQGGFDEAFVYAADNGAAISQNSWGGGSQSAALENAIDYFVANGGGGVMNGGLSIFAAGNDNSSSPSVGYPASYAPNIAVASTQHNAVKSSFSNYGSWVDIAAPGSNILSTYPVTQGSYNSISGTSMACPHVSGVAALVLSKKVRDGETISAADLRSILESTANPALLYDNNSSYSGQLGIGMLDAYAALTGQVAPPPPPPTCVTSNVATSVTLNLTTDNYGSETSWSLKDNLSNSIIASGSGYANNSSYTETFNLSADGNYTFTISDSYGDGICCSYGSGSYSLVDANNTALASGGAFGSGESTTFCTGDGGSNPPVNTAPVANAGGPYTAIEGNAVTFNGTGSSDADGDALTYAWDFGDGSTGSGATASHTYTAAGSYTATLTVSDAEASDVATASVTITVAPQEVPMTSAISMSSATQGRKWRYGIATITVADAGQAVANATVSISWSGAVSGSATGTTNSAGQVSFTSSKGQVGASFTATITNITRNGFYWDAANSQTTGTISTIATSSVSDSNIEATVYPNPVMNGWFSVNVQGLENAMVSIYSVTGNVVFTQAAAKSQTIEVDATKFQTGLYFVKVQSGETTTIKKVIIK